MYVVVKMRALGADSDESRKGRTQRRELVRRGQQEEEAGETAAARLLTALSLLPAVPGSLRCCRSGRAAGADTAQHGSRSGPPAQGESHAMACVAPTAAVGDPPRGIV